MRRLSGRRGHSQDAPPLPSHQLDGCEPTACVQFLDDGEKCARHVYLHINNYIYCYRYQIMIEILKLYRHVPFMLYTCIVYLETLDT